MPLSELRGKTVSVKLWTRLDEVEPAAREQLLNVAALPWVAHHVAVMPDVHFGKGATVGSVIAMRGAVSPAAVGVDIGCGMAAARTNLRAEDLPTNLGRVRGALEGAVPVGFESHGDPVAGRLGDELGPAIARLMKRFCDLTPEVQDLQSKAGKQVGTLGGGNHFIEICLDTTGAVWLMLHSGSRNIGKSLADVHITRARKLGHNENLPDRDLAVFLAGTKEMKAYRHDLYWAQEYAALNRRAMLHLCEDVMRRFWPHVAFEAPVLCHHNYVAEEMHFGESLWITRKGAISAERGQLGIIPGSMGAKSFIVRGLGHPESFRSASHGAGRRMSRAKAKKQFSVADLCTQTAGVECRKDAGVLDEIPQAYKDINQVMKDQSELVEIVTELKQVLCVKG
jgi:tRNA-splicing ligase RtcB